MYKKIITVLLAASLLTACGSTDSPDPVQRAAKMAGSSLTDSSAPDPQTASSDRIHYKFSETLIDELSDEEIIQLANIKNWNNSSFIDGYYTPDISEDYTIMIVPEDADFDTYTSDPAQWLGANSTSEAELVEDNDLYRLVRADSLYLFPKNFREVGNGYARYLGGTDEQSVLTNFDLIGRDRHMICRRFRDDPEIKCLCYDFYDIIVENGEALLYWRCFLPDRTENLVSLEPEWNLGRAVPLNGSADADSSSEDTEITSSEPVGAASETIELSTLDDQSGVMRLTAKLSGGETPDSIDLMLSTDFGYSEGIGAVMYDDGMPEISGDETAGDGIYTTIYQIDPEIPRVYSFSAFVNYNGSLYFSNKIEVSMIKPDTDPKKTADLCIDQVTKSQRFESEPDEDQRRDMVEGVLLYLKEHELIVNWEDVVNETYKVVFEYADGSTGEIDIASEPFT